MIQKIIRGKNFVPLLDYLTRPGRGGDTTYCEFLAALRIDGTSPRDYALSLRSVAYFRPEIERPVIHVILRAAPTDSLSSALWQSIAEEYMERLGYGEAPFVAYRHHDIPGGDHIHIVGSRVDWNCKLVNASFDRPRGRLIVRDFEQRYQLTETRGPALTDVPTHGAHARSRGPR